MSPVPGSRFPGEIDPGFLITHKIKLEGGPDAYKMFQEKSDGCVKVVINP